MVGGLLLRGMLAGVLAGLLAFGFAWVFGEPQVDKAIAFEGLSAQAEHSHSADEAQAGHSHGTADAEEEPELVSRQVQSTIGLLTGVIVYGAGLGGLFALVFAFAYGRVGDLDPRSLAALLAIAAFLAVYLVPSLKYPANPPAVGQPETIGYRTGLYFFMVAYSIAALAFVLSIGRHLASRLGSWNGWLAAAGVFIVIIAVGQALLPDINEVPADFPAVVLWRFRVASLGTQVILWSIIGLLFGVLAERSLIGRRGRATATLARQS
ncbi:MAG: CbtA family protein [Rhodospirillales bacterium]